MLYSIYCACYTRYIVHVIFDTLCMLYSADLHKILSVLPENLNLYFPTKFLLQVKKLVTYFWIISLLHFKLAYQIAIQNHH